ncbi:MULTISPECIES: TetR family transcriptional regulator [Mycolicibacterium]|jgi:AcrR family transcriptional regulator|uniref:Transcriptional regulator n=2 Tax=Mycolicibacterium TaxID=1866885 RepID=A0A378TKL7_9MYCO|nr:MULTISPECIES: TetR family transcriptional regulator [Mycolicibacterium]MCV7183928.1 TetR/AcrR family transcriptional regulator [Mycolicibacterium murale]BBY84777.1 TetR family transcriptional regulator [Mycolicibacterium tokaiense]GFG57600.1 TetR family transcriptional regulator [Mycolicibacterium murale]STZ60717.1 transcriptional regulator [Mycolicibacterium tokaiense]
MGKKPATPGPRDERGVLAARIMRAARDAFAETGWAGTTIRSVARAADVDPALVYHYFGSKEGLLDAATTPEPRFLERVAATWTVPEPDLGRALVEALLANWADPEIRSFLRAVLQTAAHEPTTREKLRLVVERSLIGVSRFGTDDDDRLLRSGLISSQLMGFALMRYVWEIEPVASMSDAQAIAALAPTLQRYVDGDLG